jgi:hypothetical protein
MVWFRGILVSILVLSIAVLSTAPSRNVLGEPRGGPTGILKLVVAGSLDTPGLLTVPNVGQPYRVGIGTSHFLMQYFDTATSSFKVTAWGLNDYGQTDVPAGLTNVAQLVGGRTFSMALKSDGSIVAWGKMYQHGPPSDPTPGTYIPAYVPAEATDIQTLVASNNIVLALKRDGTVVQWGWAYCNVVGDATCPYDQEMTPPVGLSDVSSIDVYQSATRPRMVAIKQDGTVVTWGATTYNTGIPSSIPGGSVSLGERHALSYSATGGIIGWGEGSQAVTTAVNALTPAAYGSVAARDYSFAISQSSTGVFGWGDSFAGTVPSFPPVGTTSIYINALEAEGNHLAILYTDYTPPPTATNTPNGSETITPTPTKTRTATRTPTATKPGKPSKTATRSRTFTRTRTLTRTSTLTPTASQTFTPSLTKTPSETRPPSLTKTRTPTKKGKPTATPKR